MGGVRPERPLGAARAPEFRPANKRTGGTEMLWAIAVVLLVLWAIGFFFANLGNIIHFLLVIAVVLVLGNLLRGVGRRGAA